MGASGPGLVGKEIPKLLRAMPPHPHTGYRSADSGAGEGAMAMAMGTRGMHVATSHGSRYLLRLVGISISIDIISKRRYHVNLSQSRVPIMIII
jgi:hypothetical protein